MKRSAAFSSLLAAGSVVLLTSFISRPLAAQGYTPRSSPCAPELRATESSDAAASAAPSQEGQRVALKTLASGVLHDQKPIWLSPVGVVRGHHWKPVVAVILGTAGLVALDPHDTPYFRRTETFHDLNKVASGTNTGLLVTLLPLGYYGLGLARKDSYTQRTGLLATEALADAEIVVTVMKNIDRRLRPSAIPPGGDFTHTWFKSGGGIFAGRASFPSGHTIAAFSVAAVFSRRYPNHHWLPWVTYGAASLIGFSRVSNQAHFPSDVFAGAALGYTLGRYVVLRH